MVSVGTRSSEGFVFHRHRRAPRASVRRPRPALGALLASSLLLAACAGVSQPRKQPGFQPPASVAHAVTMATPAMDPEQELELLARFKTPPALLRSAWLHLQVRRPQNAIDAAAEVLYGAVKPSANEESFARYLRAEAYAQSGYPERGQFDREKAAELAVDAELRRLLAGAARKPAEAEPTVASVDLVVQPRSAWGARPADRSNVEPMGAVHRVTIHHSAMYFRDTRPATCGAQLQLIQRDHMTTRGYGDIGYHYVIDPSGRIWQGRDLRYQGAHASGNNNVGNIGICLLGNFMRGKKGQGPTDAQVLAMRQLVGAVMKKYRFGPEAVYCHSDFKATDCPGPLMEPVVAQMVRDLQRGQKNRLVDASAGQ